MKTRHCKLCVFSAQFCRTKCDNLRVRNRFKHTSSHTRAFFPSVRFICQRVRLALMEKRNTNLWCWLRHRLHPVLVRWYFIFIKLSSPSSISFRPQIIMSRLEQSSPSNGPSLVLIVCIVGPSPVAKMPSELIWTHIRRDSATSVLLLLGQSHVVSKPQHNLRGQRKNWVSRLHFPTQWISCTSSWVSLWRHEPQNHCQSLNNAMNAIVQPFLQCLHVWTMQLIKIHGSSCQD